MPSANQKTFNIVGGTDPRFRIVKSAPAESPVPKFPRLSFAKPTVRDNHILAASFDFEGRQIRWHKQTDANSCGFCVLLNLQSFVPFPIVATSASALARSMGLSPDRPRINSNQMGDYIRDTFGSVIEFLHPDDHLAAAVGAVSTRSFRALIVMSGDHYRAIVPSSNNQFLVLDSMREAPHRVSSDTAAIMVKNSIGLEGGGSTRWNRTIGIPL